MSRSTQITLTVQEAGILCNNAQVGIAKFRQGALERAVDDVLATYNRGWRKLLRRKAPSREEVAKQLMTRNSVWDYVTWLDAGGHTKSLADELLRGMQGLLAGTEVYVSAEDLDDLRRWSKGYP